MLSQDMISKYITPETHVYISGPPGMVTSVREQAKHSGAAHICTDSFVGY
jgi:NAD(P)H-flavin reductase